MMGKRMGSSVRYLLLIVILMSSSVLTGCFGYKVFSNTEGSIHFQFEYRADMRIDLRSHADNRFFVGFRRYGISGWPDKDMIVDIDRYPNRLYLDIYNASELLDNLVARTMKYYQVAQVLERSPITIGGIKGEIVTYSLDLRSGPPPLDAPPKGEPQTPTLVMITRLITFDHDGFIWMIKMSAYEKVAEEAKSDFEHVIQTFKILK